MSTLTEEILNSFFRETYTETINILKRNDCLTLSLFDTSDEMNRAIEKSKYLTMFNLKSYIFTVVDFVQSRAMLSRYRYVAIRHNGAVIVLISNDGWDNKSEYSLSIHIENVKKMMLEKRTESKIIIEPEEKVSNMWFYGKMAVLIIFCCVLYFENK